MNRRAVISSGLLAAAAAGQALAKDRPEAPAGGRLARPIDPRRTAHLCIDLQNGFMEKGAPVEAAAARDIVPRVNAIGAAVRAAGATNVFLQFTLGPDDLTTWSNWFARMPPSRRAQQARFLERGGHYQQLWPALEVKPGDLRIEKSRFSAFVPGSSDLHRQLQARGIDTLIVTGTLTNVCCESSARDAMQMNYRAIFIEDATAARTLPEHVAAVANMRGAFGEVLTAAQLIAALQPADPA